MNTQAQTVEEQLTPIKETLYAYYDPMQSLDDLILHSKTKARIVSSLAWYVDSSIINNARGVFYDLYSEINQSSTIDSFNEFINAMAEMEGEDAHTFEIGFEASSRFGIMKSLFPMSEDWHTFAEQAAGAVPAKYIRRTLDELLANEKPMTINELSKAKMQMVAKHIAKGDDAKYNIFIERMQMQAATRSKLQHERRQMIRPAITRVIEFVKDHANPTYEFHALPTDFCRVFVEQMGKSADRALSDMMMTSSISTTEFASVMIEIDAFQDHVKDVLKKRYPQA